MALLLLNTNSNNVGVKAAMRELILIVAIYDFLEIIHVPQIHVPIISSHIPTIVAMATTFASQYSGNVPISPKASYTMAVTNNRQLHHKKDDIRDSDRIFRHHGYFPHIGIHEIHSSIPYIPIDIDDNDDDHIPNTIGSEYEDDIESECEDGNIECGYREDDIESLYDMFFETLSLNRSRTMMWADGRIFLADIYQEERYGITPDIEGEKDNSLFKMYHERMFVQQMIYSRGYISEDLISSERFDNSLVTESEAPSPLAMEIVSCVKDLMLESRKEFFTRCDLDRNIVICLSDLESRGDSSTRLVLNIYDCYLNCEESLLPRERYFSSEEKSERRAYATLIACAQ